MSNALNVLYGYAQEHLLMQYLPRDQLRAIEQAICQQRSALQARWPELEPQLEALIRMLYDEQNMELEAIFRVGLLLGIELATP